MKNRVYQNSGGTAAPPAPPVSTGMIDISQANLTGSDNVVLLSQIDK